MQPDKRTRNANTRLVDAVREVKIAAAERQDVVVDMKEADRARLDILAQELQPVFNAVPLEDERFDFALSSGLQPRLWIDATAHVMMARDRRTYRFVRDTRIGRIVLAESTTIEPIANAVTNYIAERLHERELAFAADEMVTYRGGVSQRSSEPDAYQSSFGSAQMQRGDQHTGNQAMQPLAVSRREHESVRTMSRVGWFALGLFVALGAGLLYVQLVLLAP